MLGLPRSDGMRLTRRECLRMSTGALGVLLGSLQAGICEGAAISWQDLVSELVTRSEALYQQKTDEDAYVADIVRLLKTVDPLLIPAGRYLARARYFAVSEFVLQPGKGFPFHDHRDYNGVLLVASGSARFRTFDVAGADRMPPAGVSIELRQTSDRTHRPGELSTLTTARDNVHDIRAGESGCRLIDIATWLGPDPRSITLDVKEPALDAAGTRYAASFTSF